MDTRFAMKETTRSFLMDPRAGMAQFSEFMSKLLEDSVLSGATQTGNNSSRSGLLNELLAHAAQSCSDSSNKPAANLEDMLRQKAASQGQRTSRTRFAKFLELSAEGAACIQEEKFDQAYGVLAKQMELGEQGNFASLLINYYRVLVSIFQWKKAKQMKSDLFLILKENLKPSPKDCELKADSYREEGHCIKAILLYQAAEDLYDHKVDSDEITNCLQGCILGLKMATMDLMDKRPDLRRMIAEEIVPAMRRCYDKLSNMFYSKSKSMVLVLSLCLHHIETTELLADDNRVRETTLIEAVDLMDLAFQNEAAKHHLYSAHLNNLAVVVMTRKRPKEAIEIFEKAIKSRKLATDYDTEAERKRDLHASEDGLKKAVEMLKYMYKEENE